MNDSPVVVPSVSLPWSTANEICMSAVSTSTSLMETPKMDNAPFSGIERLAGTLKFGRIVDAQHRDTGRVGGGTVGGLASVGGHVDPRIPYVPARLIPGMELDLSGQS